MRDFKDAWERGRTPGYRYSVGAHSSTLVPARPPTCPCQCHLNVKPSNAGSYCPECHSFYLAVVRPGEESVPFSHEDLLRAPRDTRQWMTHGPPDYWYVTEGNSLSDKLGLHFSSAEEAKKRAAEMNDQDVLDEAALSPELQQRARRYKELTSGEWYSTDYWWAREHERYAVECWGDDCSSYWETVNTLDELREALRNQDAHRAIDLDTGEAVEFKRTVSVEI